MSDDLKDLATKRINKFIDSKKDVKWEDGEQQWLGILKSNLVTLKEELDDSKAVLKFKVYTKKLDRNRKQHIANHIPELEKFIYG